MKFCAKCGSEIHEEAVVCVHCGQTVDNGIINNVNVSDKSKTIAGLLQLLFGSFAVGRFYMGDIKTAILQIVVTWITCGLGGLWPFIDGIMILCGSEVRDADGKIMKS